ncbi:MAG: hypothetical protein KatS3mg033_1764 [Thermonema sp.]|uniref:TetR family transcriptional regulator C-terminal domain-containing protein n=1 Tax=Thermonema sp. TaxID=2231181 RepID=UPI0021DC7294|nr:TetR family transcriptional regulator C-terminal domain-containing protein [Thermonema sp.]GIV39964.1 MAG: hypothetical protein KatS3mg033_1764 [Thermonema sp.]
MAKKTIKTLDAAEWQTEFKAYLLRKGKRPANVFLLAEEANASEKNFYDHYNSLDALEKSIWRGYHRQTIEKVENNEEYARYSIREKYLLYAFTLLEVLKEDRSYLLVLNEHTIRSAPYFMAYLKAFEDYAKDLIQTGIGAGELVERPFYERLYPGFFVLNISMIIRYWLKDESEQFEKSDVFIEKSVNALFDLITPNVADSITDFGKFLFQELRKK